MTSSSSSPSFDKLGRYALPDYDQKRPFSSFLPGIAGHWGVPMWVFYVNRGQGVASFGIESKENPILEYQPANKAYQLTPSLGFRTFLKLQRQDESLFYEPFAPWAHGQPQRQMRIGMNELELIERGEWAGIETHVHYFVLPGEPFAGLVRQVILENTGDAPVNLEVLDGLPAVIPYGVDNGALKHVSRTIEAWMQVENYEQDLPFYRLRASAVDHAEVSTIKAGHFAFGFRNTAKGARQLPVLVDPNLVFGSDTSLHTPTRFLERALADLLATSQADSGKTPCAFFGLDTTLDPGQSISLDCVYGHVNGIENLRREAPRFADPDYLAVKRQEARDLAQRLTDTVHTQTAHPLFDAYIRQTFLDNVLRGGWPVFLGDAEREHVYHIYSRKHGDLERDYNDFFLAAEFFSQGNGNYRDVNQNRRCDVLLEPRVEAKNIRDFLSLIQLDGYNPLVVKGTSFSLPPQKRPPLLALVDAPEELATLLESRFTPGELLKMIADRQIGLLISREAFLAQVMASAEAHLQADFGTGFWVDHWTYLLDQIESYLAVFPEKKHQLLLGAEAIPFYQSPVQVRPRHERYVLSGQGPRQYHALADTGKSGWTRGPDGEIYSTSVIGKLILLAVVKFSTLDPQGMGIEMEAGKPGWYDALNGLPGMFGSSMPESYELLRLLRFLRESLADLGEDYQPALPAELAQYLEGLAALTETNADPFSWWEETNHLREGYRAKIYQEFSGQERVLLNSALDGMLATFETRLREGISRAEACMPGEVPPSYFRYEVTEYKILKNENGIPRVDGEGRPYLQVKGVRSHPLPPFLEGAVRSMKVAGGQKQAKNIHKAVQASPLYDEKLNMYKVNAALGNQPHEIGRARAFTPGWLENESVWLHMAYKYLLGLLQAELYEEFWEAAQDSLVCFLPPEQYGRSPLENSSFIVSSAHPDETLHVAGFVARLSGSTAEFVNMWSLMMVGKRPFVYHNNQLYLRFRPALPAWLFDCQDQIRFNFLGSVPVTYHNPGRVDSWNLSPKKVTLHLPDGQSVECDPPQIPPPYTTKIRNKEVKSIDVFLS